MKCWYCGMEHEMKCPMIKAFEYGPDGKVTRIEFVTFADMLRKPEHQSSVVMPEHGTRQ